MSRVPRGAGAAAIATALLLAGCAPTLRGTPREQIRQMHGRDVEATLHSGERVVLRSPIIEGDSVVGGWTSSPAGDVRLVVALADIESLRSAPPPRLPPEKLTVARFVERSLTIGFAACVALLLSFAVLGM